MRIASLVPSATEALFALGLGPSVVAVTHECDYPAQAERLPKLTSSVIETGLDPAEIDARVREVTGRGESLYRLDERTLAALAPELIVTQALCAVCAVSYDDVRAVAARLPGSPAVLSLDPETLEQVLGDVTRLASATDSPILGERLLDRSARPPRRGRRRGRRRPAAAGGGARVARSAVRRRPLGPGDDRARRRRGRPLASRGRGRGWSAGTSSRPRARRSSW